MKSSRTFGEIRDVLEGDLFKSRIDLSMSKVHKPIQAGISGSENEGADSIVISGGYEDDEDLGSLIIYTGQGGRSNESKVQVADQMLTKGNKGLAISCEKHLPVRVIRKFNEKLDSSTKNSYRYDGLYLITKYWREKGKSGFNIWRFRLEKINYKANEEIDFVETIVQEPDSEYRVSDRKEYVVNRIIRETKVAQSIKELYNNSCQICGLQIKTPVVFYSEAAHIKALGKPHNGPDVMENMLCLCPNHHIMFDLGIIALNDDFSVLGLNGVSLTIKPTHEIGKEFVKYHREQHYKGQVVT